MSWAKRYEANQAYKTRKWNEGSKVICLNCGKLGNQHYMVKETGKYDLNCPTKVEGQYYNNQFFERGTNLGYLQRLYEKRHGVAV